MRRTVETVSSKANVTLWIKIRSAQLCTLELREQDDWAPVRRIMWHRLKSGCDASERVENVQKHTNSYVSVVLKECAVTKRRKHEFTV